MKIKDIPGLLPKKFHPKNFGFYNRTSLEGILKRLLEKKVAIVTVCNACLSEACWKGEVHCENYKEAGTEDVIREVKK